MPFHGLHFRGQLFIEPCRRPGSVGLCNDTLQSDRASVIPHPVQQGMHVLRLKAGHYHHLIGERGKIAAGRPFCGKQLGKQHRKHSFQNSASSAEMIELESRNPCAVRHRSPAVYVTRPWASQVSTVL